MQTRTAVLHAVGDPISVETLDLSAPRAGEVRVRIRAAGVCHSDWHLISGATQHPLPAALGHEGAGEVVAVGPGVTRLQVGDSVSLNWAPACGECFYCLHDSPCLCDAYLEPIWAGVMLDGTPRYALAGQPVYHYCGLGCFSDYVVVPVQSCVLLDPRVPASVAALIGCAVTTGVGAVLNTAQVRPGSSVAIFGAGGVGMSMVLGAKLAGAARIIVVDRVAQKGEFATSLGDPFRACRRRRHRRDSRADRRARGGLRVRGGGVSGGAGSVSGRGAPGRHDRAGGAGADGQQHQSAGGGVDASGETVKGSYYGSAHPPRDFPFLASLYLDGLLDLDSLITRTYRLEEINSAYTEMLAGSVVRSVVLFE
ncbi:MAG: alcohol dehydrogenase catalytic domain-containing protein [Anaerolineales bacterium]|nr:alcohol dehydrogenase catalytic domain-containing protein [Anaerolineales bacterium]